MLDRRALMSGGAAALAAPVTIAATPSPDVGRLAELIADWFWAHEAEVAAAAEEDRLRISADIPPAVVRCGKRRLVHSETGEVSFGQWEFSYHFEVKQYFNNSIEFWQASPQGEAAVRSLTDQRDKALAELDREWQRFQEAKRAAGITAAERVADLASDVTWRLRNEILDYRPANLREAAAKVEFMILLNESGLMSPADIVAALPSLAASCREGEGAPGARSTPHAPLA